MKTSTLALFVLLFPFALFATGEPSTYFNIYVPPNNDNVQRNVCLVVTAIYDNTTFTITDDGMDGDTDDSVHGTLMAGQSYILYIKDNGINDDAASASTGVYKHDGDYFIITSSKIVYASQSTDSDWQHDFVPATNKSSVGNEFIVYAPRITSSKRDLNVFAYTDSTTITISRISTVASTTTGYTQVDRSSTQVVVQRLLMRGQDIIHFFTDGRNLMNTGETYLVEANRPVSLQYGALFGNERDGGGYVPSSNGSSTGDLFYFAVPYQALGEQEIRVVSWDPGNNVSLERYSNGTWVNMSNWTIDRLKAREWVGKSNGNVSFPTVFRVTCTPGKRVSVFEANWLETGNPGTSDIGTMACGEDGSTSGTDFLVYMAPPGNEHNVRNPFTGTLFGQQLTHVYLYSRRGATVTVKDANTEGAVINRTYTIAPGRYADCFLTLAEWRSIYNGTGTVAGGSQRPYLLIHSDQPIAAMITNFNDNWMMYCGSSQEHSFELLNMTGEVSGTPGTPMTVKSVVGSAPGLTILSASVEVQVESGLLVLGSRFVDPVLGDTAIGTVNQTVSGTQVTFPPLGTLQGGTAYEVNTDVLLLPAYSNGAPMPANTVLTVSTTLSGTSDDALQQASNTTAIANNTADAGNLLFSACPVTGLTTVPTNSWSVSWADHDNDGDDDLFVGDRDPLVSNQVWRNNGNGGFTRINTGPLATDKARTLSSAWADIDNDGDQDALVLNVTEKKCELYLGDGQGGFSRAQNTGLSTEPEYFHGATWADHDNDGFVDVLFTSFMPTRFHALYHNNGNGTFSLVPDAAMAMESARAMAPAWCDYDQDGLQDVFIPNGGGANNGLFRNTGSGQFAKVTSGPVVNDGGNSVGACWGDIDNDGDMDLYVTNASFEKNFLYLNSGDGTFVKVTGTPPTEDRGYWHGCSFVDLDNDGDLDLYVTDDQHTKGLYFNDGSGGFTRNQIELITLNFGNSYGASWADHDRDGDMDLFVATHTDGSNALFCNRGNANSWSQIKLVGTISNTNGIGARVRCKAGGVWLTREVNGQAGFGGQHSLRQHFGLGSASTIDSVEVRWPSGVRQVITNQPVNTFLTLTEPNTTTITGSIYHDLNANCQRDAGEPTLAGRTLIVQPGNITVGTDQQGGFSTNLMAGSYTFAPVADATWSFGCAATTLTSTGSPQQMIRADLPLQANNDVVDVGVTVASTLWRRGFKNNTTVQVGCPGTRTAHGVNIQVTYPPQVYLLSADLPYTMSGTNTYTWQVDSLPVGGTLVIHVVDSVGLGAFIGQELQLQGNVSCNETDGVPANNTCIDTRAVVGAVDPNDILVSPRGAGSEGHVDKEVILTYTIRFQNVGTWAAENVLLTNFLPLELDASTFEVAGSSHSFTFELDPASRKLMVRYPGILLPDSTSNEAESHGFFSYRIKPSNMLQPGERIRNEANIVFDYEDPLLTNKTLSTIAFDASSLGQDLLLAPNPAEGIVRIAIQTADEERWITSTELTDMSGRIVLTINKVHLPYVELDVSNLGPSVYLVTVTDVGGARISARLTVQ